MTPGAAHNSSSKEVTIFTVSAGYTIIFFFIAYAMYLA